MERKEWTDVEMECRVRAGLGRTGGLLKMPFVPDPTFPRARETCESCSETCRDPVRLLLAWCCSSHLSRHVSHSSYLTYHYKASIRYTDMHSIASTESGF